LKDAEIASMRTQVLLLALVVAGVAGTAAAADPVLLVSDPTGQAARFGGPVSVKANLDDLVGREVSAARLRLIEISPSEPTGNAAPVQYEPAQTKPATAARGPRVGTLWWIMPPGPAGQRRFRLTSAAEDLRPVMEVAAKDDPRYYEVLQQGRPVLRYNFGTVPPPPGIDPKYARGDYIHPLFGLSGEVLSDDYPKDHPHHRGVGWSWPVTRWNKEVRDIWAVAGVWSRPNGVWRAAGGPVWAGIEVENVWKWGDKDPIVREEVLIRPFRKGPAGRFIDIEVRLAGTADGVAIGGRPHAGYGGFGLRGAPAKDRKITARADPAGTGPRRSWLDYSGLFKDAAGPSGVTILESPANPGYPNELHQYPDCNYVMPAFPAQREVPLARGQTLVLRHRLWIHDGVPEEKTLAAVQSLYANPPTVTVQQ
jgi:hypothetical protein